MAEGGMSELNYGNDNVPGWTNGKDLESKKQRYDILRRITRWPRPSELIAVLESGWDVNERLYDSAKRRECTALTIAVQERWIEGVKMLLDAGAECMAIDGQNPLTLAHRYEDFPFQMISLLLKHGADPNDHDGEYDNIPLFSAIRKCYKRTAIVRLLLEHGADPCATSSPRGYLAKYGIRQWTVLHQAVLSEGIRVVKMLLGAQFVTPGILAEALAVALHDESGHYSDLRELIELIELLLEQGADVNHITPDGIPLLHLMCQNPLGETRFFSKSFDLFFQSGCNINVEDDIKLCHTHLCRAYGTVVQRLVKRVGVNYDIKIYNSNILRRLIRHGADVAHIRFRWLGIFIPHERYFLKHYQVPLILLEAGMRVPHGVQTQLSNMEVAIHTWLQESTAGDWTIERTLHDLWVKLEEAEEAELKRMPPSLKKTTFTEYLPVQMADLQEFSDESLNMYPEDKCTVQANYCTGAHQHALTQIRRVLKFLCMPRSLQWNSRHCVRESLVSLQPSVVKTLPIPAKLKRYILCHEI